MTIRLAQDPTAVFLDVADLPASMSAALQLDLGRAGRRSTVGEDGRLCIDCGPTEVAAVADRVAQWLRSGGVEVVAGN